MFSKKESFMLAFAVLALAAGFALMAIDPADNGFGIMTLWIAPPLLLAGFFLPIPAINGSGNFVRSIRKDWQGKRLKHIAGLLVFATSLLTYMSTLEPTASLWDCSEFIASAYKLQVPHTPGTPLSLLVGRLFTMLSFGDITNVAGTVNLMSAFFSALTASIAYYLIYHLCEKAGAPEGKHTYLLRVLSAGGGSLCLAFSDTFWFSAVEAETYGPACFFLVLILWLIITGKHLSEPLKTRRLVLIFYLSGLAYCIHPMCLLALAVLPFTWYTHDRPLSMKHVILTLFSGLAIILIINRFVAVGIFELAFSFDRFLVNQVNMPFYSGALILFLILVIIFRTIILRLKSARAHVWAVAFLLLGFTPYLLLFIRSNHNPPIDEANPEDLALIKAYMNREGYPSSPLLYGPYFDARIVAFNTKKQIYFKAKDGYQVAGSLPEYQYDARQTFLPRLYSNDPAHIEAYQEWTGLSTHEKPTFANNLHFLFTYQLGHMYLRYLMWNFAGRESDVQNSAWLKPWERSAASHFEKARNQYWMIPFLIGLLGAVAQYRKDLKGFVTIATYFLITGLILALYLNSPPVEPRERDYIYVGSYMGFCIWIGLGLHSLGAALKRKGGRFAAALMAIWLPAWMFFENYNDHDRSGRTFQVDNAKNILRSCAPGAILFTGGDNDTFPLWYVQEVEGFRTDVRVMVMSYMNTDWYINQLRKTYYDSGAFKLTLDEDDYRQYGPNDVLYVEETIKNEIDAGQYLKLLKEKHPALTRLSGNGEPYHILPSRSLTLTTHPLRGTSGTQYPQGKASTKELTLTVSGNYVSKNLLAIIDIIVSNEWQRPVYFNFTSLNNTGTELTPYVVQEGPLYRLTPDKHDGENIAVNTALTYQHLVEWSDYSNLRDSEVYFNYEDFHLRMLVPVRQSFNSLALAFLNEGNAEMAAHVLEEAVDKLYHSHLRPSYTNLQAAEILSATEKNALADLLSKQAFDYFFAIVKSSIDDRRKPDPVDVYLLRESAELLARSGDDRFREQVRALGM